MDDQAKKAVELVQGVSKLLIGLAALIVLLAAAFADRFYRPGDGEPALGAGPVGELSLIVAAPASCVLSMMAGVWTLLSLISALRPAESDATASAPRGWMLGWNVRFPLLLQSLLFVAGVGFIAGYGALRKPSDQPQSNQAAAPALVEQITARMARLESRLAEQRKRIDDHLAEKPDPTTKVAAERLVTAVDKLTLEVAGVERAFTEQATAMIKQQRLIAVAAARQRNVDIERIEHKSEIETMGTILSSLRTIMKATLASAEPEAYRQFWTVYSGPFLLVRTPELTKAVDECAVIVRELEEGPVLNATAQAKLKAKVAALVSECRGRYHDSAKSGEEFGAN